MIVIDSNQISDFKPVMQGVGPNQMPLSNIPNYQQNFVYIGQNGEEYSLTNFPLQNPQIIQQSVVNHNATPS